MRGRALWFAAGAGAGAYVVVRAKRAAEIFTVDGLRDRVGAAVVGARIFRDEVAQGKADAETELRPRLGLALTEHAERRELTAPEQARGESTGPHPGRPTDRATDRPTDQPTEKEAGRS
ncbi:DUF6167 family protein [Nocardioides sp. GXZ039]|uniref:DUF6167 family protein n=1 Tax=Nocardioides sp. GXZ039 TaxID=3136018 RepID=UPI0030F46DF0